MSQLPSSNVGQVDGKNIIVTGCASGIGAEVAALLRRQGANVIGVDRNSTSKVDQFFLADLSDESSIAELVAALPPNCDGLCNIAGLPPTSSGSQVLKVNFVGLRLLTESLVPKLADGASITNLASLAGIGWPDRSDQVRGLISLELTDDVDSFCDSHAIDQEPGRSYFLSKEALIVWTMQQRWRWRDRGIRMNCVSPGPVETPILPDFVETLGDRVEEDMRVMDRAGTPKDIAPLVAFLQSDGSAWLRGINVPCDGGMFSHVTLNIAGLAV